MRVAFYYLLLLSVVALAILCGRRDERIAAGACVFGTLLTAAAADALPVRFDRFDHVIFFADCAVLLCFLAVALHSSRFWPIWVTGFQLTATTVHLLKILRPDLMGFVFGVALAFWSYPILLLIGIGALRTATVERWRAAQDLPDRG